VQVVQHHLKEDSARPQTMQDDFRTLKPYADEEEQGAAFTEPVDDQPDKIIVYSAFPSSNGTIKDVRTSSSFFYFNCFFFYIGH
jgi:hypothetical protein